MAITDIIEESEVIDAGAPSIKYKGDRPLKKEEMKMAGPDWYIKRIEHLMSNFDLDYEEAGKIADDSEKYYEYIGHDPYESRNMDEEVVEEGIMRAANGGVAMQGGVKNYLGDQKTVSGVPVKWQSGPDKPSTELAYITKAEKDLILKKDLHGSLKDGPNMGPGGLMSLDSWGDIGGAQAGADVSRDTDKGKDTPREAATTYSPVHASTDQGTGPAGEDLGSTYLDRIKSPADIKAEEIRIQNLKENEEQKIKEAEDKDILNTINQKFVHPTRKALYGVLPNNPRNEFRYINYLKTNNPVAYGKLPPELIALYEATEDQENEFNFTGYKDFDKFSFDDFESLRTFNPGEGVINFADHAAKYGGAPALKYAGNVGNLETIKNADGTYSYTERTGDGGGSQSEWQRLGYNSQEDYENRGGGSRGGSEEEVEEEDWYLPLAFRAEGGRVGRAYGGIMGDDGRRAYGLGSIFKKIKKVFKSPLGKAALLGLGGYKMGIFGGGKNFKLTEMMMGKGGKGGLWNWAKDNPFAAISGASALSGLMANRNYKKYDDWNNEDDGTGLGDPDQYRYYYNQPLSQRADGGRVGAQEGGLMDMGGMEKDYREDGGFVPIGGKEKADDVPARLSKNEFVMTADAVRGAGDGNIDKGSEVMYNIMKNLEAGGGVSEETQGLDGAREMFQTSQRLEEVL